MECELCLVNWALIPAFLKEAVVDFPFECAADAQVLSDLMVSQMRGRLIGAPELDDAAPGIEEFMDCIEVELVYCAVSNSINAYNGLISQSKVCRQMLLCQLLDQMTCFLPTSFCNKVI
jgi:hypothetical protein